MPSFQCPLVGAHFRSADDKACLRERRVGDQIELRADPDNQHDSTAVGCWYEDHHLGFIPATDNGPVFEALQRGDEVVAEIIAFENTYRPVLEIDLLTNDTVFNDDSDEPTDEDLR